MRPGTPACAAAALLLALLLALALAAACGPAGTRAGTAAEDGPGSHPDALQAEGADTLRGVVAVVGAQPLTSVVVRGQEGPVAVRGGEISALARVPGLTVRLVGEARPDTFVVASFRVVEHEGTPAADGILEAPDGRAVLLRPDGSRVRYAHLPAALEARIGQRVWIAGPPGGDPVAWGVIEPD